MDSYILLKAAIYFAGFFLVTLLIRYIVFKIQAGTGRRFTIWSGYFPVLVMIVLGVSERNYCHIASIVGYLLADAFCRSKGA